MRENNEELERILNTLSSGIERKVTVEKIINDDIKVTGKIIEVFKESTLDENTGGIKEVITFNIRPLNCGCVVQNRHDVGGVCQKCGNIVCQKHFYRCLRCGKGLCCRCMSNIEGIVYCKRCSRIIKFLRFLKFKK